MGMTDEEYRAMSDSFDAMLWAMNFCKQFNGASVVSNVEGELPGEINEGTMVGWFANFGMKGYDLGVSHQRDREERLTLALKRGWDYAQYIYAEENGLWAERPGDGSEEIVPPTRFLGDSTVYEDIPSSPAFTREDG
jgi:hypothetical protein